MKNYFSHSIVRWKLFFIVLLWLTACNTGNEKKPADETIAKNKSNSSLVEADLSDVSGSALFMRNCTSCHSMSYIENQPAFPRKTWEKIVDKMIKNFGAPVPDSSAQAIVSYLVAIKGKS